MTFHLSWRRGAALLLAAVLLAPALAHEGHDHGDEAPAVALPALAPRTEAASDLFELLVMLDGAQLVLWIDRFSSNEPVPGARIEVEGEGWKAVAGAAADGSWRVTPPQPLGTGSHALLFTVQADANNDLLEATLVVPPPVAATVAPPGAPVVASRAGSGDLRLVAVASAAVLALGATTLLWRRRRAAVQEAT